MSYRVRPSHGCITPESSSSVHIVLAVDSKKNDKFLVKWVAVGSNHTDTSSDDDFNTLFSCGGKPVETRLKCIFPVDEAKANVVGVTGAAPLLSSANASLSSSPVQSHSTAISERSLEDVDHVDSTCYSHNTAAAAATAAAPNNTNAADVLKKKLADALSLNEQLQRKIDSLQVSHKRAFNFSRHLK